MKQRETMICMEEYMRSYFPDLGRCAPNTGEFLKQMIAIVEEALKPIEKLLQPFRYTGHMKICWDYWLHSKKMFAMNF